MRKPLAAAHRRIADREHADEQRLLNLAPRLAHPGKARARARELSEAAERHSRYADRVEGRAPDEAPD
jgi:hypothetical protein